MASRSKDKDVATGDASAGSRANGNPTNSAAAGHVATKGATAVHAAAGNGAARPRARWVAPVLTVAAEHLNPLDSPEDLALLVERIETMRGRKEFFVKGETTR